MAWTKEVTTTVTIPDGLVGKRFTIYLADAASEQPGELRVLVQGIDSSGAPFGVDHRASELSLSSDQVAMLTQTATQVVAEMLDKQDFVPASP